MSRPPRRVVVRADGDGTLKLVGLGEPGWLAATAAEGEEIAGGDLLALGRIASEWAALRGAGRQGEAAAAGTAGVVEHLTHPDAGQRSPSRWRCSRSWSRAGAKVQGSATAWTRLLEKVREQVPAAVRQSA